jgi:hypothetical protein
MKVILFISILALSFTCYAGYRGDPQIVTATEVYSRPPWAPAYAKIIVDYANVDKQLRKPLIVFEGFDPGVYTKPTKYEGRIKAQDFIDDIVFNDLNGVSSELNNLLQGNIGATPPVSQQYDIVYVNWANGADYLQDNMLVAMEVIKWVNTNKIAVGGIKQPNVVLGKSMGSIIARMALKTFGIRFASTSYRTFTPGTPLTVSYNTPGLKEWTYRMQISGGSYLYAHSLVMVGNVPPTTL